MNTAIFVFYLCFIKIFSQNTSFVRDKKCVYNETGNFGLFKTEEFRIEFYITWKTTNTSKSTETLYVSSDLMTFSIPHPLSSSYQSVVPKEYLRIGWNEIVLVVQWDSIPTKVQLLLNRVYKVEMHVKVALTHFTKYKFQTVGLYSFLSCNEGLNYYMIPPKTNVTIPWVLEGNFDTFIIHYHYQFSLEVTLSERLQICKEDSEIYVVNSICSGVRVTTFQQDIFYQIFVYSESYDPKDVLRYKKFTFTEITFHNIGEEEFYVEIPYYNNSNAPIELLQGRGNFKTLILIISCGTILIFIGLIVVMICCINYFKKPQQRSFETPMSLIDFHSWPGQTEGYVNAKPTRDIGHAKDVNTEPRRNEFVDEFERRRLDFFSSGQNILFVDYLHPSLGVTETENEYEQYERPQNEAEYKTCDITATSDLNKTEQTDNENKISEESTCSSVLNPTEPSRNANINTEIKETSNLRKTDNENKTTELTATSDLNKTEQTDNANIIVTLEKEKDAALVNPEESINNGEKLENQHL